MLTLSEAIKTNRINEFVKQEEARGVGPVSREDLDAAIQKLADPTQKSRASIPRR
jgi:hypothetical protein